MKNIQETLTGYIDRITFHNEESGFCILKARVKGHKDLVTIVGNAASITPGEWFESQGYWESNRQYGPQFKTEMLSLHPPSTLEGIEKYLGSGLIKGIGPGFAQKLIKAFGTEIFTIIENTPEYLSRIPGIGSRRIEKIISGWREQKVIREIMLFLHTHHVSTARSVRIYKVYGQEAILKITQNPYCLAKDIKGIGFLSADKIALHLGMNPSSIQRACAGISYALSKAMDKGHTCLPEHELIHSCQELLGIDQSIIIEALESELSQSTIFQTRVNDTTFISLKGLYYAEQGIADKIGLLTQGSPPWLTTLNIEDCLKNIKNSTGIVLSPSQQDAFIKTLSHKLSLITGGPGVGKTTLLRSILYALEHSHMKIALCAPTGRAAKRLGEATGMDALTIHRLLNINPVTGAFTYNESYLLDCDVLIVDEVSMVDTSLMYALVKAIPPHAALILVGDKDQLPSVGPGQILTDLLNTHFFATSHLTQTFRQGSSSIIVKIAREINQGLYPKLYGYGPTSDFFFLDCPTIEETLTTTRDLLQNRLPNKLGFSPLHDIQILCPMTRGLLGTRHLNMELQKALNPTPSKFIQKFGVTFAIGDKIMQIENNYHKEVYNGDIGFISEIDEEEGTLLINFEGKNIIYEMQELDEIVHAYAMTIHKSQGSEYPVVIMPLVMQHYPMLQKNLIYTGITRGKKLVILVGEKKALKCAVHHKAIAPRWTLLPQWFKERTSFLNRTDNHCSPST